ncbi:hypothetical protein J3R30DRAFT_3500842 [Lentinula aciculospora]|uniref:Secreted protein n=1 Tax=Lentinula aciculospora TaxID=153920 RepID=A0A9W9A7L6_9AGAR|nr:hypothetical protein J3R30DRAFT_3500842 [Lentinula aciculospora]
MISSCSICCFFTHLSFSACFHAAFFAASAIASILPSCDVTIQASVLNCFLESSFFLIHWLNLCFQIDASCAVMTACTCDKSCLAFKIVFSCSRSTRHLCISSSQSEGQ